MKLNAPKTHVCFGAKDDQFGRFWIPVSGSLEAVKLVHVSGTVTCGNKNSSNWSFWGCGIVNTLETITTVITNSSDYILLPQNQHLGFKIPGYHSNSSQLVYPDFQPPLQVSSGQEMRLWYSEDWNVNGDESNNAGLTCADIYATILI